MVFPSMSVAFFLAITRYLTGATEGKEGVIWLRVQRNHPIIERWHGSQNGGDWQIALHPLS